jgi:hypothetical protein
VDVDLFGALADDIVQRLNASLPEGIAATGMRSLDMKATSLMAATGVIEYRVTAASGAGAIINGIAANPDFVKHGKRSDRVVTFGTVVHSYCREGEDSLVLRLYAGSEESVRIDDTVKVLAGAEFSVIQGLRIIKIDQFAVDDGKLARIE